MIVWALFDSGNGSYYKVAKEHFKKDVEIYPIGLDKESQNNHFIELDLSDYSRIFGNNTLYEELDKLPPPDLIIASPPCESWSVASAMRGGNACWKQESGDSLFDPQTPLSRFTVRDYKDYEGYQFNPEKSILNRINGELCIYNTVQIIKRYKPKVFIVENPAYGRIWDYIEDVLGFHIEFDNFTYYNNYDYPISKPTKFKSNIDLSLLSKKIPNEVEFSRMRGEGARYNYRSNIPEGLVLDIFNKVMKSEEVNG